MRAMSPSRFLSALAVVALSCCGTLGAFGQAPVRAPTSDDALIWCQPKFDRQVPMSVCEEAFQPQSQMQIAPAVAPERPPSLEDAAASLQKSYDSLTKDPQKIKLAECTGVKIYEDPQPPGHPPSAEECVQVLRQFGFARDKTGKLIELPSADNQKSVQQTDPYADSYQQQATAHFRQELNGLSNTIHNLNFALGCLISPTARGGKLADAIAKGYEGRRCTECGNFTLRRKENGIQCETCKKMEDK